MLPNAIKTIQYNVEDILYYIYSVNCIFKYGITCIFVYGATNIFDQGISKSYRTETIKAHQKTNTLVTANIKAIQTTTKLHIKRRVGISFRYPSVIIGISLTYLQDIPRISEGYPNHISTVPFI
jgi:hypothetical protein